MEQNKESKKPTWEEAVNNIAEEIKKPASERFAMEILKQEQERSKAKDRGVIALGILTGISILAIVGTAMFMSNMNHQNDKEWRDLFNSYEFITQDGSGQNYYNSEVGGNVNNGSKNNEEKDKDSR